MIGKAMIEIPPKFKDREPVHPGARDRNHYRNAEGLAEDVKHYGEWMREQAFARIGHLYPQVDLPKEHGGGKATVIAWIWSRTVASPDPAFGDVQVPIASSFLLSSKAGKEAWIEPIVDKAAKTISYRIRKDGTKEEIAKAKEGTKAQARVGAFRCIMSVAAIRRSRPDYVKAKGNADEMGQTLDRHCLPKGKAGAASMLHPTLVDTSLTAHFRHEVKRGRTGVSRNTFLCRSETPARLTNRKLAMGMA